MNTSSIQSALLELKAREEQILALIGADGQKMPMAELEKCNDELMDIRARVARMKPLAEEPQKGADPYNLGMDAKEAGSWSLLKAIESHITGKWHAENSLERQASDTIANRLGMKPRGFYIPSDVGSGWMKPKATQRTTNDGAGGFLVADDLRAESFIDILRARLAVYRGGLGATVLSGLVGNTYIPRRSGSSTAYWVAEGTGVDGLITASDGTFQQVSLTPKTCGAATQISRTLVLQGTPDIERLVRDDLLNVLVTAIDEQSINGTGLASNPTGLLGQGITQIDAGGDASVATWADVVQLESEVAEDNGDVGRLAYLTHPAIRGYLKSNPKVAGTSPMMWADDNTLNGYAATVSSQCPGALTQGGVVTACALIYGNWSDLVIGLWGGLDVIVDTSTYSLAGAVRLVAFQSVDVAVRHAASFAWKACARA
jgi:HK97 family phage major capsid protein